MNPRAFIIFLVSQVNISAAQNAVCMFSKIRKRRLKIRQWKDDFTKRLCNQGLGDELPALRTYLIQLPDFTGKRRLTCSKDLPRESELDLEPPAQGSPHHLHKKAQMLWVRETFTTWSLDSSRGGPPWPNTGSTAQRSRPVTFVSELNVLEADAWRLISGFHC